jgi:hypothetical protein
MVSIDKNTPPACFLSFGDDMLAQRGFAGRFGPGNFHDPAARQTSATQGYIQFQRPA